MPIPAERGTIDERPLPPAAHEPVEDDAAVWVDLCEPDAAALDDIARRFGLHELAVEDARERHQRPKLERYGDTLLIVAKPAVYHDGSETIDIGELLMFVGDDFVVSVRHGVAVHAIEGPGDRGSVGGIEVPATVHGLLDQVVDGYLPIAAELGIDIRQIEADVFAPDAPYPTARIYLLKRQLLDLQRHVVPLLGPLEDLSRTAVSPLGADGYQEYFRDIADHTRRLISDLDRHGALLSDVLQANLAQLSVAQNEDMRRMSAWAAIFLVPSLLAGIWGMNFRNMPELDFWLGYPLALLFMVAVSTGLWIQFRRIGWLGK